MADRPLKTKQQMDPIFNPKSVAIVGATPTVGTVPYDIFANIMRDKFQGLVYPVSPGQRCIDGVKTYKYILDIDDPVDLAILVFPSSVCHMAVEQCGKKGVKGMIIISAGFKEVGAEGLKRERQLVEIAEKYGISFIGPNCLGVINTDPRVRLDASFARKMPDVGNIGFLSQSGALCTAVLDYAQAMHIGFSKFVSFGNKADISEIDLLYYLKDDPETKVILLYLEEVSDGPALMKAARDVIAETGKPILALKSGRTSKGAAAAASHTGSLAGSDDVTEAGFRQAGIIRCNDIQDMFNYAIALAYQPLPAGPRVAIVTNAGGPGVLCTDSAISRGLEMPGFTEETTAIFKAGLPATANIKNPVDVIGDARADRYEIAVKGVLDDPNIDGAFVILTPQSMTDIDKIADEVATLGHVSEKPLYTSFMGKADVSSGIDILERRKIPHYLIPESMCKAYSTCLRFKRELEAERKPARHFADTSRESARAILEPALAAGRKHLPQEEAEKVLEAYGLPLVPSRLATKPGEAGKLAAEVGFPVVMKVVSDDVVHKIDVGGVVLDITSPDAADEAYDNILASVLKHMPAARIKGVLVGRMLRGGTEMILGIKRDPSFGPVVMFGLGGSFVEVFKDVAFRVAPIEETEVASMVRQIKGYPLLAGARGRRKRDVAAIEECLARLSQLAVECPEVAELDVNPLIVLDEGQGCFVADARIML